MRKRTRYWTSIIDVMLVKRQTRYHDSSVAETDSVVGTQLSYWGDATEAARSLLGDLAAEAVVVILLDGGHRVIGAARVALGVPGQCVVFPRTVFTAALLSGAASVIMAHNHPGGGKIPSKLDWDITYRCQEAGKILGIPFLDHIIISDDECISMRESPNWDRGQK